MRMDAIDADAQNLGVRRLETRNIALQGGELGLSATGKIENIEGKQHVTLAAIILKACLFADRSRERKRGRLRPSGGKIHDFHAMPFVVRPRGHIAKSTYCGELWYPR